MKQHSSVVMLFMRSSIYKIFLLFLVMIASESIWFYRTIQKLQEKKQSGEVDVLVPEVVFEEAHLMVIFAAAVIVMTVILACVGRSAVGHQEYTWNRLSISPNSVFAWQAVYNCSCFLMLWFVQAALAYGLCLYYVKTADAGAVTHQSLFLAFYREPFLHGLVPLHNIWYWVRNIFLFCALGFSVAYDVYCAKKGKKRMWVWWLVLCFGLPKFRFNLNVSNAGGAEALVYAGILIWMIFIILCTGERKPDDAAGKQ